MSRTIITLIAVLLSAQLFAQIANEKILFDYPRTLSEQVVNPTADATAMLRYRDCPVSYATGTADVTVPLLSWKEGDIDMSLALSYHTGGIKVDDEAGYIGLGWSLRGLGRVSRQICAMPDESLPFVDPNQLENFTPQEYADILMYKKEANYDRYNYDFPGYSGSFLIVGDSILNLTPNDVKIRRTPIIGKTGGTSMFTITSPEGFIYTFGGSESCEHKDKVTEGVYEFYDRSYKANVVWNLTGIVAPNSGDRITISYAGASGIIRERNVRIPTRTRVWSYNQSFDRYIDTEARGNDAKSWFYNRAIPTKITGKSATVLLSVATIDEAAMNDKRVIRTITMCNSQGDEVRKITLDNSEMFEDKRPRLDAVIITSDDKLIDSRKFEYNSGPKASYSDFFGFANGIDRNITGNVTNIILPDKLTLNPNRETRKDHIKDWSLKKITDATGVVTTFDYIPAWCPLSTDGNKTIYRGLLVNSITSYDPITGRQRIRQFSYEEPQMSVYLNALDISDFISLSGVKTYGEYTYPYTLGRDDRWSTYKLSATFTATSCNAGFPAENMVIYYDKVTETVSGTDMQPIKTEYYFDNTHCIHSEGRQSWPALKSASQSRMPMVIGSTGPVNIGQFSIKLGENIPYESYGGVREYYLQNNFVKVFGHRSSVTYFDERVNPEPLLIKKITYECRSGAYRPLETVENFYSSHDRFSFYAGLFVQSNVYKTFHENDYTFNLVDGQCPGDGSYSTLHNHNRILSERLRLDSTSVTRHYPDGSTRKIWQRHYYDRFLSSPPSKTSIASSPSSPSDTLSFNSSSLLPVSTVTSFGTEYAVHSVVRASDIQKQIFHNMRTRRLGRTPVTEKWYIRSLNLTDSLTLNREFAFFTLSYFHLSRQTLSSDPASVIARQKFNSYDLCGHVTSMTEADGTNLRFTWDDTDNLLLSKSVEIDGGSGFLTTSFTHKPLVGCTSVTLPNGTKHSYSYSAGRLKAEKNTSGETVAVYDYSLYGDTGKNMTSTTVIGDSGGATTRVFYDGFGLPVESVVVKGSGDGKQHVATYTVYDGLDRPVKEYRPVAIDDADEIISPDDYATLASTFYNGDSRPFTQTSYFISPGERIAAVYSPGEAFEDHPSGIYYLCNNTKDAELTVRRYIYLPDRNSIGLANNYPAGALDAVKTVDPDGHTLITFTNWLGHKVLERRLLSSSQFIDTYYINDVWGKPLVVLQPEASKTMTKDMKTWKIGSDTELSQYAFIYRYDRCGRLIYSRVPGCKPVEYRYDEYGREIFMRDGNMVLEGRCRFTLYDKGGRPVVVGMCDDEIPFGYAGTYPSTTAVYTQTPGICNSGYAIDYMPVPITNPTLLTATYYDSYNFLSKDEFSLLPKYGGKAPGLPTGTLTAVPDYKNFDPVAEIMYYDQEGRNVETYSSTHLFYYDLGDFHSIKTTYTRNSLPKNVTESIFRSRDNLVSLHTDYEYDPFGRPKFIFGSFSHQDKGNTMLLARNSYNQLGQLYQRETGKIKSHYEYNMDGSLKTYTTPSFGAKIYRENSDNPCYNGSISQIEELPKRKNIKFDYDMAGRLISTTEIGPNFNIPLVHNYSYDLNTNITSIKRTGKINDYDYYDTVDDITLKYTGNQLQKADDDAYEVLYEKSFDFYDGVSRTSEYLYDHNGNLRGDANRGILMMDYNVNNLPTKISFSSGRWAEYIYDAGGRRLQSSLRERKEFEGGDPVSIGDETADAYIPTLPLTIVCENWSDDVKDYVGNFEILQMSDLKAYTPYGYFDLEGNFYAYLRDYQGNIRAVMRADTSTKVPIQRNNYYPYGLPTAEGDGADENDYLYGGKEFDTRNGVNVYDFGARTYAPDIARFWQPDPMAHDYHWLSPYAYCGGDPVNFIDPNGMQRYYVGMDGRIVPEEEARRMKDLGHYAEPLLDNDQIVIINESGVVDASEMFDAGTIKKTIENVTLDSEGNATRFSSFVVEGDKNSKTVFEFLADNITGINGIEYSMFMVGKAGNRGLSFISTSHTVSSESGWVFLFDTQLKFGYNIRSFIHSHKYSLEPGYNDGRAKQKLLNNYKRFNPLSKDIKCLIYLANSQYEQDQYRAF